MMMLQNRWHSLFFFLDFCVYILPFSCSKRDLNFNYDVRIVRLTIDVPQSNRCDDGDGDKIRPFMQYVYVYESDRTKSHLIIRLRCMTLAGLVQMNEVIKQEEIA